MTYQGMIRKVRRLGIQAARSFRLPIPEIKIVEGVSEFGTCEGNTLEIRLLCLREDRMLREHTIIDTLAHEVAHLDKMTHSKEHRALTSAIKMWLKRRW